ncbi:MAG TPA: family 1 encapsulin nanocompartment shell protein [Acidimicrobiales bacterium]|nr:family 1 encapsulin nanocompartment shell protein [Acidimicrobiales bacterium]
MTDHLRRQLAPVGEPAWSAIETEAGRTLRHFLSARPVVDVEGPAGWDHSAQNLGRVDVLPGASVEGVEARRRRVLPLVELRTPFTVSRDEIDAIERGAAPDLQAVTAAARQAAMAEDRAVFDGMTAAGIRGVAECSPHAPLPISDDYDHYAGTVARAVALLRREGVGGPYAIVLGPRCYTGVVETTEHGGYPLLEHIRLILGGPVIWGPSVDGALVVSLRGGDYVLTLGQDFAVGYNAHTATEVELYLEETFAFEVQDPTAAVALRYLSGKRGR